MLNYYCNSHDGRGVPLQPPFKATFCLPTLSRSLTPLEEQLDDLEALVRRDPVQRRPAVLVHVSWARLSMLPSHELHGENISMVFV